MMLLCPRGRGTTPVFGSGFTVNEAAPFARATCRSSVAFEKNDTLPVGAGPPLLAMTTALKVGEDVSRKLISFAGVVDTVVVVLIPCPTPKRSGAELEVR